MSVYFYQNDLGLCRHLILLALMLCWAGLSLAAEPASRVERLLSDANWQFVGAPSNAVLPQINNPDFGNQNWQTIAVPHVFQTRSNFFGLTQSWYRHHFEVSSNEMGKRFYLIFEGAASVATVYVNGQCLGEHRGAYTRFAVDATGAVQPGKENELAVYVDNDPRHTRDCLPNKSGLYTVWGGLYRKVWLITIDQVHIDMLDYASSGVYLTPRSVSITNAHLEVDVRVRNDGVRSEPVQLRTTLLAPGGIENKKWLLSTNLSAQTLAELHWSGEVATPQLWSPTSPQLYHVRVEVVRDGRVVDAVIQPTGFRNLRFDVHTGRVTLNGAPIILKGANLHQEIEGKRPPWQIRTCGTILLSCRIWDSISSVCRITSMHSWNMIFVTNLEYFVGRRMVTAILKSRISPVQLPIRSQ